MKKIFNVSKTMLLVLLVIQLISCRKLIDQYFHHDHGHDPDPEPSCIITGVAVSATTDRGYTYTQYGSVFYDNAGKPDSIILDSDETVVPSHYFHYDALGRLKEYIINRRNDNPPFVRHRYGYEGNGTRIVVDTTTQILPQPAVTIAHLAYDNEGRIYEESRLAWDTLTGIMSNLPPIYYIYDTKGNLVIGEQQEENDYYDSLPSLSRTNKIWMFLIRNYSKNNRKGAIEYNEQGLPIAFNFDGSTIPRFLDFMFLLGLGYDCK